MKQKKIFLKDWKVLGLCLLFIAPILSALGLFLFREHFEIKINPQGELLPTPLKLDAVNSVTENIEGRWQLVYFLPNDCNHACQHKMQLLNNLNTALGKDKSRVQTRFITPKERPLLNKIASDFEQEAVLIVDPKGWIILHYRSEHFNAKGMLQDLRRLLRYSHVG